MNKAFTIIELIFVIVIIGILAAIAIPKLSATRDDASIITLSTNIREAASELASYALSKKSIDDNITKMSKVLQSMITQKYATQIDNSTINIKAGRINNCVIIKKVSRANGISIVLNFSSDTTDKICNGLKSKIDINRYPVPLTGSKIKL